MNQLRLTNHMLNTTFQTMKLVIHIAKIQQIIFFVHRLMVNINFPIGYLYYGSVLLSLPGVEKDSSNRAPMIIFNTHMTQFTCSHHGILIRKKSPPIWMQKEHIKDLFLMLTLNPNQDSWFHTHETVWESKPVFHSM